MLILVVALVAMASCWKWRTRYHAFWPELLQRYWKKVSPKSPYGWHIWTQHG